MRALTTLSLFLATCCLSLSSAFAQAISVSDAGTYTVIGKSGADTELQYRLSGQPGRWKMEGKMEGGKWKDVSCSAMCAYEVVPAADTAIYMPAAMRDQYQMACIRNKVQAFCRMSLKSQPAKARYLVVALVVSPHQWIRLRRVTP